MPRHLPVSQHDLIRDMILSKSLKQADMVALLRAVATARFEL